MRSQRVRLDLANGQQQCATQKHLRKLSEENSLYYFYNFKKISLKLFQNEKRKIKLGSNNYYPSKYCLWNVIYCKVVKTVFDFFFWKCFLYQFNVTQEKQEGGSGWGRHVNSRPFHFNVWQNSLQIKKKKVKKKKRKAVSCNIFLKNLLWKISNKKVEGIILLFPSWPLMYPLPNFNNKYPHYRRRQWRPTPVLLPGKSHG